MAAGVAVSSTFLQGCLDDNLGVTVGGELPKYTRVDLFVNDHTPNPGDTISDYTIASWSGYGQQTVTWGASGVSGGIAYTDSNVVTFPVTSGSSGVTVYGYVFWDTSSGMVYGFSERVASPLTPVDGFPINLQVRFRHKNP